MERFEFKYLLDQSQYLRLRRLFLAVGCRPDTAGIPHQRGRYPVISLYFDTVNWRCYWEKQDGIADRVKYRLRTYDFYPNTNVWAEVKIKNGDVISKERDRWTKANTFKSRFERTVARKKMIPRLLVTYWREPWVFPYPPHNLRLTFDQQINGAFSSSLWQKNDPVGLFPGLIILEIKTNNAIPGWLHQIIKTFKLQRLTLSKYCLCLEKYGIVSRR